jgi:hypothetical protein
MSDIYITNSQYKSKMPRDGNGGFVGWQHQADSTIVRRSVDLATLAPLAALIAAALATFA